MVTTSTDIMKSTANTRRGVFCGGDSLVRGRLLFIDPQLIQSPQFIYQSVDNQNFHQNCILQIPRLLSKNAPNQKQTSVFIISRYMCTKVRKTYGESKDHKAWYTSIPRRRLDILTKGWLGKPKISVIQYPDYAATQKRTPPHPTHPTSTRVVLATCYLNSQTACSPHQ